VSDRWSYKHGLFLGSEIENENDIFGGLKVIGK
jgi:hypothetical protein